MSAPLAVTGALVMFAAVLGAQEPPSETQGGETPSAEGEPAPDASVPRDEPVPASLPTVTWPLDAEALAEHLQGIAASHPECAQLETIGTSSLGREIRLLRLGARETQAKQPALFLADFQGPASAGPEALVTLAWRMADEYARDEELRALLERVTLVLAPALDPDVRSSAGSLPAGTGRSVRFERNFPSGWQPESVRAGAGRVSLCTNESLASARYLSQGHGCAAIFGFVPRAPRAVPYAQAEVPAADRDVFAKVAAAVANPDQPVLVPWTECATGGGSLFDFAYQARGIYPFFLELPSEEELAAAGSTRFAEGVLGLVRRSLPLLPRVVITRQGLERVAADTWRLDIQLENVGLLPTSSALARRREASADLVVVVQGAKLFAVDKKEGASRPFADASFEVRTPLNLGTLEGGQVRALSLFLEGSEGVSVEVRVSSPCAGEASLVADLR